MEHSLTSKNPSPGYQHSTAAPTANYINTFIDNGQQITVTNTYIQNEATKATPGDEYDAINAPNAFNLSCRNLYKLIKKETQKNMHHHSLVHVLNL